MIGSSDPYVLINLLGTNIKPIKTKSIKNNLNPVWNESFSFNVSIIYLSNISLKAIQYFRGMKLLEKQFYFKFLTKIQ